MSHPDGELFGRMEAGTKKEVLEEAAKECTYGEESRNDRRCKS